MAASPTMIACAIGALDADEHAAIIRLCEAAFAEPLADLFAVAPLELRQLRAYVEGRLTGHACWWPRQFQPDSLPHLTTAYVKWSQSIPPGKAAGSAAP